MSEIELLIAEIKELKQNLIPMPNTLPIAEALKRLGRTDSPNTWRKWRSEGKTNGRGIPLTYGFHWTDIGGVNLKMREIEAWLADDPSQWDELVQWQKAIAKSEKIKTNLASLARTR